jgi:hypothetical protein
VERVLVPVVVEEVDGPAILVRRSRQVLASLDNRSGTGREFDGALSLGKAWQTRAWMGEVGENLVDNLDWQRLEGAPRGGASLAGGDTSCVHPGTFSTHTVDDEVCCRSHSAVRWTDGGREVAS